MKLPVPRRSKKPDVPRRSLVLVLVGVAGLVAALVAKRALSGGGEPPPPPPPSPDAAADTDRAGATWAPQPVPPATTPEAAPSATNGGGEEKSAPTDASAHAAPAEPDEEGAKE